MALERIFRSQACCAAALLFLLPDPSGPATQPIHTVSDPALRRTSFAALHTGGIPHVSSPSHISATCLGNRGRRSPFSLEFALNPQSESADPRRCYGCRC